MVSLSLLHLLPWWQGYWKPLFLCFWHQSKHHGRKEKNKPEGLELKLNGHGFKDGALWSLIKSISYLLLTEYPLHLWGCMRYTASIAIASGASTLGQSYTLWVRSVHCVLNMQMSGTEHLGGSLWHQHFFLLLIYMHHYLLCPILWCFCCDCCLLLLP